MVSYSSPLSPESDSQRQSFSYRPGDLVVSANGYPTLYEVIAICEHGQLRLRGVNWASGYSALVAAGAVRPTSAILHDE